MKYKAKFRRGLKNLWPAAIEVSSRERWRVALASGLSLALIALYWRFLGWAFQWEGQKLGSLLLVLSACVFNPMTGMQYPVRLSPH